MYFRASLTIKVFVVVFFLEIFLCIYLFNLFHAVNVLEQISFTEFLLVSES